MPDQLTSATAGGTALASSKTKGPARGKLAASPAAIPWQERPAGLKDVVWRHSTNPVIGRRPLPDVLGIYNSAVVPFGDGFAAVFRLEDRTRFPRLHMGWSDDGLQWHIEPKPIVFQNRPGDGDEVSDYAYDPRVVKIEDKYYITWCGGTNGPTISVATTTDFQEFTRLDNAFLPHNRNGVLFPRRIDGKYFMLSRPSDTGHTPFGDIYISQSPDMVHWGKHRKVMGRGGDEHGLWWQRTKIGAGPVPIETDDGWLMIYHGVLDTCNGFVYHMGAAILDLDDVFPVAALCDQEQDRLAVYYGAADTVTCLCYSRLSELISYIKENSLVF
jgi:beta-1,4-mannooligosaccharide/beta-1,4-mannosyl-N-acetylglucosamine phosphorylase